VVAMSPRNLTRVFKDKTGITILEYLIKLRIERARTFLNDPHNTMKQLLPSADLKVQDNYKEF
jgi:transcriptional regulator GlxA family with amidase domain